MLHGLKILRLKAAVIITAFMLFQSFVFGQMIISIDSLSSCENTIVHLPVNVSDFNNVNSIQLHIEIDTMDIAYLGLENVHPQMAGGSLLENYILNNSVPQIVISWYRMSAVSIANGKLFDLVLNYKSGSTTLQFASNCEIAQGIIPNENVIYNNGAVMPLIIKQPQPLQKAVGESAVFSINQSLQSTYQWQRKIADVWIDLTNTHPYSGTDTYELTINNLAIELNNALYRCIATNIECEVISDSATLLVSPLKIHEHSTWLNTLNVFPIPNNGFLHYQINSTLKNVNIAIINIPGERVYFTHFDELLAGDSQTIITNSMKSGLYFLQLIQNKMVICTVKIICN